MREQHIILTTDCVVFNAADELLLVTRGVEPFSGMLALPGGRVGYGETVEAAAKRELAEESGLSAQDLRLIGVYSDPQRDPRGHYVSVAFLVTCPLDTAPRAGSDAAAAAFTAHWHTLDLAFDHHTIITDALMLRERLSPSIATTSYEQ